MVMCRFFELSMLFLCKAPLACAITTLSGLTFQPFVQFLSLSGLYFYVICLFLNGLVGVHVICVIKYDYLYGERVGVGFNNPTLWLFFGFR